MMKKFALIGLLALLIGLPAFGTAQEDRVASHKTAVQDVYASAFNAGDLAVLDTYYAPEYVNHGFGSDLTLTTFKETIAAMRAAMPDFQATVEVLIADEEWAASRLLYSGTFEQAWAFDGATLEPTGEKLQWSLNVLYHFDANGQIVEEFTAFDRILLPMPADAPLPPYITLLLTEREHTPAVMETPVTTGREAAHKETFSQFIEAALNTGDLTAIDLAMAADHRTHEPFGDFTREEFKQIVAGFRATVPDLHVEIEALVAEGDWLAARLIYTGTFANAIPSDGITLEPTQEPIRFIIHVLVRFNADGQSIEDFKEYNRLGWLQQVGIQ